MHERTGKGNVIIDEFADVLIVATKWKPARIFTKAGHNGIENEELGLGRIIKFDACC